MGKGTKLYRFECKTDSRTVKNTTQNAPKLTILRPQIKNFLGGAQPHPRPFPSGDPTPHPFGRLRHLNPRACGASSSPQFYLDP